MPLVDPIDNPISIEIESLNHSRLAKFLQTNEYFSKLLSRVQQKKRMGQYSDLNLVLFKPTSSPKRDSESHTIIMDSPMKLLHDDDKLLKTFIRFTIRLQLEAGFDQITIPFLEFPFKKYQDVIEDIIRSLDRVDKLPLFFLDIKYEDFSSMIDWQVNTLELNSIGLYYRPFRQYPLNYNALSEFHDQDVAFITTNINRYDDRQYALYCTVGSLPISVC